MPECFPELGLIFTWKEFFAWNHKNVADDVTYSFGTPLTIMLKHMKIP